MGVHRTADFTAVWRSMGNVDQESIKKVGIIAKIFGYLLGILDKNSVRTISERTKAIDSVVRRIKPKYVIEIGCGHSMRAIRFSNSKFYKLDLPIFDDVIPFDIKKDKLNLDISQALFIIEGVTMYIDKKEVEKLLKEIKKYNGQILVDFFSKEFSSKQKTIKEKIFKFLFRLAIKKRHLFDFRINDIEDGTNMLRLHGYKEIKTFTYKIPKTLDVLFYARL